MAMLDIDVLKSTTIIAKHLKLYKINISATYFIYRANGHTDIDLKQNGSADFIVIRCCPCIFISVSILIVLFWLFYCCNI